MTNNLLPDNTSIIRKFYEEAFQFYDGKRELPEIAVEFYPYIGINQTIRVREGKVFVRLAELCRDAPPAFQRALANRAAVFSTLSKILNGSPARSKPWVMTHQEKY